MQITQAPKKKSELAPTSITEMEIANLLNLRESKSFLKKRLEQIDSDLESLEQELIGRIEDGAEVTCRYPVSVKVTERRYPSWKDAFLGIAGEQEAKRITESTAPTISKSLIVTEK